MKVLKTKKIEGCMEGTNIVDFKFDSIISEVFVRRLAESVGGNLKITTGSLPLPHFTIIVKGLYTLKGNIGNTTLRAMLSEGLGQEWADGFTSLVEESRNGD